ncbi:MAG: phosphomannomutase/phosphoglucomutase, partial [Gammaproteobacteria bacterium]
MEMPATIFRAYDIRGVVGKTLTPKIVRQIGRALGSLYPASQRVAVGRDGRLSSPELADALCQGLMAAGRTAIDVGQVPTPVLYYATHRLETGAGVMITGSHNPPHYNGIKMVMDGHTLYGDTIRGIYDHIIDGTMAGGDGRREEQDLAEDYVARICGDVKLSRPLRIAVDCGNGVAGPLALELFARLGCEVEALYCDVDGNFPNHHPNPSEPENLTDL